MDEHQGHTVTGVPGRPAAHAARPGTTRLWPVSLAVGAIALTGAALALASDLPGRTASTPSSARSITVTPTIPLPPGELAALTAQPSEAGPLADPERLSACLAGLGYPAASVLGATELPVDGPAVVLVLSGDRPGDLHAVAVRPDCGAGRFGVIAEQVLPRP